MTAKRPDLPPVEELDFEPSSPPKFKPAKPIAPAEASKRADQVAGERGISQLEPIAPATPTAPADDGRDRSPSKVTFDLPAYVRKQVDRIAFEREPRVTLKFIIMEALKKSGVDIAEQDLKEDGRRGRVGKK